MQRQRDLAQRQRDNQRRRKYGLTPEGYAKRLQDQGGVCAVCGEPPSNGTGAQRAMGIESTLYVDHDHVTGEVRGLLCNRCNSLLGYAKDNGALLRRAGDYLLAGGFVPLGVPEEVEPTTPTPEAMGLLRRRVRAMLSATVTPGPEVEETVEPEVEPEVEPLDHRKLCMQVDLLDQSGDPMRRDSPFQERRRRQIEAIRAAFSDLFNGRMLTVEAAKRWLVLTDDSAEEVFDTIEYTRVHKGSQMESPIAYIERVLKNKKEERKKEASVRPANLEAPQSEPDYYLKENSPRTKMVKDKLRSLGIRFAGDGLGPMPEEDD